MIIKVYYVIIIIRLPNPLYLVYVSIIYCNFLLQKSSVWDVEYWRMAWVMQIHPSSFSPSDIYSLIIFWRNIVDVEGLHYTTRLTRFTQNLSLSSDGLGYLTSNHWVHAKILYEKWSHRRPRQLDWLKIGCFPESLIFHLDQCFSHCKWSKYQYKLKL